MATDIEVAKVLTMLTTGLNIAEEKALSKEAADVFIEMLVDLPYLSLITGAKRILATHKYPSFPSIADIREAAIGAVQGRVTATTAAEAWALAWRAAGQIDPDIPHTRAAATRHLPPLVLKAMDTIGVLQLIHADKLDVVRAHFLRTYEGLVAAEKQRAMLPPKLVDAIESGAASGSRPAILSEALKSIGVEK